jgi:hypothetical protein
MGYIILVVLAVVLVPLLFMLLVRGTKSSGVRGTPRGVIREKPSADAPSAAGGAVNPGTTKVERKTPPS